MPVKCANKETCGVWEDESKLPNGLYIKGDTYSENLANTMQVLNSGKVMVAVIGAIAATAALFLTVSPRLTTHCLKIKRSSMSNQREKRSASPGSRSVNLPCYTVTLIG